MRVRRATRLGAVGVTIALTIGGRSEPGVISSSGNIPSSITGFPAVVVPAGFTAGGLPVGVEFLGAPFTEDRPTALAYHYQTATGHRRPPASTPSLPS